MGDEKERLTDEKYMRSALDEAQKAFDRGEFPVGCVIVQNERVIATGSRLGTTSLERRASEVEHAEIRALKSLESIGAIASADGEGGLSFNPERAVLYCTMEPCLMCYAAIILSGIKRIVYAYEDVMGGGTGCDLSALTPLYRDSGITVVPHLLRSDSLRLFACFFSKKDNRYWKGSLLERYTLEAAAAVDYGQSKFSA